MPRNIVNGNSTVIVENGDDISVEIRHDYIISRVTQSNQEITRWNSGRMEIDWKWTFNITGGWTQTGNMFIRNIGNTPNYAVPFVGNAPIVTFGLEHRTGSYNIASLGYDSNSVSGNLLLKPPNLLLFRATAGSTSEIGYGINIRAVGRWK